MRKITPLVILFSFLLSGCSLTGENKTLSYYTLNEVSDSCINNVELETPAYMTSERIMVRKGEYAIGGVPHAYWIESLKSSLPKLMVNSSGKSQANILIHKFIYNVDLSVVVLKADVTKCTAGSCKTKTLDFNIQSSSGDSETIVDAYQRTLTEATKQICEI